MGKFIRIDHLIKSKQRYEEELKSLWSTLDSFEQALLFHAVTLAASSKGETFDEKLLEEENWEKLEDFLWHSEDTNVQNVLDTREMALELLEDLEAQMGVKSEPKE